MDVVPILQTTGARYLFSSTDANGSNLFQILLEYIEDRELTLVNTLPDLAYAVDLDGGIESDLFIPWEQFIAVDASTRVTRPAAVSGNDTCMILFTSGTTGRAKGVMRGHRQVLLARWLSSEIAAIQTRTGYC